MQTQPSAEIMQLLQLAISAGREAFYVQASDFDDLIERLGVCRA
jgi:hypothetical protein